MEERSKEIFEKKTNAANENKVKRYRILIILPQEMKVI